MGCWVVGRQAQEKAKKDFIGKVFTSRGQGLTSVRLWQDFPPSLGHWSTRRWRAWVLVITANVEDEDEEADVLRLNRPETFSIENIIQRAIIPGLFFVYFRLFKSNIVTNFTTNHCEKMSCQSSIWQRDSNPRHSEHEPPPITTRPGLPPAHSLFIGYQTPGGSYESCLCIQWTF